MKFFAHNLASNSKKAPVFGSRGSLVQIQLPRPSYRNHSRIQAGFKADIITTLFLGILTHGQAGVLGKFRKFSFFTSAALGWGRALHQSSAIRATARLLRAPLCSRRGKEAALTTAHPFKIRVTRRGQFAFDTTGYN